MYRQAPATSDPLSFSEHFTFGPSLNERPFYKLQCYPIPYNPQINEVIIRRKSPASGDSFSITKMQLPTDGCPDADGLVTHVYPKRAVVAAFQSRNRHHPDGPMPRDVTRAAINLASEMECCRLVWNPTHKRYELHHPAMKTTHRDEEAALVVKILGSVGFGNVRAKGTIKLINMTNQETLTSLDFGRNLLHINTHATMKVPSRHIVDVAVSTLLAVATVEGRRVRAKMNAKSLKNKWSPANTRSGYRSMIRSTMTMAPVFSEKYQDLEAGKGVVMEDDRLDDQEMERDKEQGTGNVLLQAAQSVWMAIYFTGRLGYEIVKAIIGAFRPIKKRRMSIFNTDASGPTYSDKALRSQHIHYHHRDSPLPR